MQGEPARASVHTSRKDEEKDETERANWVKRQGDGLTDRGSTLGEVDDTKDPTKDDEKLKTQMPEEKSKDAEERTKEKDRDEEKQEENAENAEKEKEDPLCQKMESLFLDFSFSLTLKRNPRRKPLRKQTFQARGGELIPPPTPPVASRGEGG